MASWGNYSWWCNTKEQGDSTAQLEKTRRTATPTETNEADTTPQIQKGVEILHGVAGELGQTLTEMQDTCEESGAEDKLWVEVVGGVDTWDSTATDTDDAGARGRHGA